MTNSPEVVSSENGEGGWRERIKRRTDSISIGFAPFLALLASGLAWGGLPASLEALAAGFLWFIIGLFVVVMTIMNVGCFVYGPPDLKDKFGKKLQLGNKLRKPKKHPAVRFLGRLAGWCMLAALFVADRHFLAATWLYVIFMGWGLYDILTIATADGDTSGLGTYRRARYAIKRAVVQTGWWIFTVPWRVLRYLFIPIVAVYRVFLWLYEKNIVARRTMQVVFWIAVTPPLVVLGAPVAAAVGLYFLVQHIYAGYRDSRTLPREFGMPDGVIYFVYAEPHQREHFLGRDGVLYEARNRVVARDWRTDIKSDKHMAGWEQFCKTPEGRMLEQRNITNMGKHLPMVAVARPWRRLNVYRFCEPYRRRNREDTALSKMEKHLWRKIHWALPKP